MFMKATEALRLLDGCEQSLRRLVAEAAAEGDYASVLRITDWARALAALGAEARSGQPVAAASGNGARAGADGAGSARATASPTAVRRPGRSRGEDYPKFFRRGDELVKVGWSKKERKEYSHR